ncbi:P-loop containing nucleoside triphosphate hydrolase protein [Xylariaceae sp. FL1272]|nr:P-loop containing nucleoside triphosphate hydrolase protein [Xylariaceae sp. FL1272]
MPETSLPTLERSDSMESFEEVGTKILRASDDPESAGVLKVDGKVPSVLHVLKYIGWNDAVIECRQSIAPFKRIPAFRDDKDGVTDVQIGDYGDEEDEKPVLDIVYKISKPANDYRRSHRGNPNEKPITGAFDLNDYRYDDGESDDEGQAAASSTPKPTINMNIHSQYLIDALQAVISYYPRVNLQECPVSIPAPYRLLYLHREELVRYRDAQPACHTPEVAEITARHINVLLEFLEDNIGDSLKKEEALHKLEHPSATFDLFWLLLKPGQVLYAKRYGLWTPFVISSIKAGSSTAFDHYKVNCWYLETNGVVVRRYMETFRVQPWSGEQPISSLPVIPEAFWIEDMAAQGGRTMREKCIEEGRLYWELLKKPTYMNYDGQLVNPSSSNGQAVGMVGQLSARVIVDPVGFDSLYSGSPDISSANRNSLNSSRMGSPMPPPLDHLPRNLPRCGCDACSDARDPSKGNDGPYAGFRDLDATCDTPPDSDVFFHVLSNVIPSFVPGSRRWACANVANLSPIKGHRDAFKDLVLDDEIKLTVRALIGKFTTEAQGRLLPWNTDIVQNKGEGRIFLLHGTPGVGKTSTAECIAESTGRPLIAITSGDLGVDSYRVESSLQYFLELGQRYGALLLLDEADVYLERRRSKDIARNSLVSTFLRALEYYRGVLFLTTNRVQAFDSAFMSRIHVALHYKNLRDEDRERIWANTFERLERESSGGIRISTAARSVLLGGADDNEASRRLRGLKWNGREIRNAMQMMLALAESEAREEGSKVVTVGQKHVYAVVNMSGDFRDYLKKTTPVEGIKDVEVEGDDSD